LRTRQRLPHCLVVRIAAVEQREDRRGVKGDQCGPTPV
jgi:hypothetical protein